MAALVQRDALKPSVPPSLVGALRQLRGIERALAPCKTKESVTAAVAASGNPRVEEITQDGADRHLPPSGIGLERNLTLAVLPAELDPDHAVGEIDVFRASTDGYRAERLSHFPHPNLPLAVRHSCASCAPVRPEITGFSRMKTRLNKRNVNPDAPRSK